MTEEEWEIAERPWPLWHHLADLGRLSVRKKSLFALATCRRIGHLLRDARSLRVIEACETHADGGGDFDAFCEASMRATAAAREQREGGGPGWEQLAASAASWLSPDDTKLGRVAEFAAEAIGFLASRAGVIPPDTRLNDALQFWEHPTFRTAMAGEEFAQAALLRELFGNPFRQEALSPDWRTGTAVSLARQMYGSRDFGAMPILADALVGSHSVTW